MTEVQEQMQREMNGQLADMAIKVKTTNFQGLYIVKQKLIKNIHRTSKSEEFRLIK